MGSLVIIQSVLSAHQNQETDWPIAWREKYDTTGIVFIVVEFSYQSLNIIKANAKLNFSQIGRNTSDSHLVIELVFGLYPTSSVGMVIMRVSSICLVISTRGPYAPLSCYMICSHTVDCCDCLYIDSVTHLLRLIVWMQIDVSIYCSFCRVASAMASENPNWWTVQIWDFSSWQFVVDLGEQV